MPIWWGCYLNGLTHQAGSDGRPLRSWDYSHSPQGSPETTSMGSRHSPEVVILVIIRYGTSARNFRRLKPVCYVSQSLLGKISLTCKWVKSYFKF